MMMPCRLLPLIVALLSTLVQCEASKDEDSCLSTAEISARLTSINRSTKRLTRVTNPGTASTRFRSNISMVQGIGEYERYKKFDCDNLCFVSSAEDDPFVKLDFRPMMDGHHPFDHVLEIAADGEEGDSDPYLMTTLRDPLEYAAKFYKTRLIWDEPSKQVVENMNFRDFVKQVPWRTNQLTRMLGRENGDERVITNMINPPSTDDEYMQEQNRLGEQSEVLAKAWERLSQRMIWFGLFHRLRDSMELLAFNVCANTDKLMEGYRPQTPKTNADKLQKVGGELSDTEKEVLVKEIEERNQLDVILMARAEALFDNRLEEMRNAKKKGILCNFAGTVEVTCGDDNHEDL